MPKIAFDVSMLAIVLTALWGLATVVVVVITMVRNRRTLNHWRRHLRPGDRVSVKIYGERRDGWVVVATNNHHLIIELYSESSGGYNLKVKSKECYYPISK